MSGMLETIKIVAGERTTSGPRAYVPLTDEERAAKASKTGGGPLLDFGVGSARPESTAYIDYHNVDVLLGQQHPRSAESAELTFLTVGQIQELLFKLLFTDLGRTRDLLFADRIGDALRQLRRIERSQRLLVAAWEPVSAISPAEFAGFRDRLGDASGLQSFMYRQLEFVLGRKDPGLAEAHRSVAWVYRQVDAALRAPSVYDAAISLLRSRFDFIPEKCSVRNYAEPYQPHPSVERAWAEVCHSPEAHRELHLLAEALTDLSYQHARWRYTHLLAVERIIGGKPGSGGTSGVAWLAGVAEHRFFPELWTARAHG